MNGVSEAQFAVLQQTVDAIARRLDDFIDQVQPLVLARSGEVALLEVLRRDVDASHRKHREADTRFERVDQDLAILRSETNARMQRVEDRQNRIFWMMVGGFALLELVAKLLPDGLLGRVFGG